MGPSPLPKSLSYDHSSEATTSSGIVQIIITIEDAKRCPEYSACRSLIQGRDGVSDIAPSGVASCSPKLGDWSGRSGLALLRRCARTSLSGRSRPSFHLPRRSRTRHGSPGQIIDAFPDAPLTPSTSGQESLSITCERHYFSIAAIGCRGTPYYSNCIRDRLSFSRSATGYSLRGHHNRHMVKKLQQTGLRNMPLATPTRAIVRSRGNEGCFERSLSLAL